MAGHSKFKNIQHRKEAQNKKRAKIFTSLVREIFLSAKSGIDPQYNPRLRTALAMAKVKNLPKDRIEKAISQACDKNNQENYFEVRYEGFAAGGISIIIEALTDNTNRTAAYIRSILSRYGGNLAETGSVSFMFNHVGIIQFESSVAVNDKLFESAIEAGAEDVESDDICHTVYTPIKFFTNAMETLTKQFGNPVESYIGWRPQNVILVSDGEKAEKLLKLIEALEDNDDVQRVFSNYELSEDIYKKLIS